MTAPIPFGELVSGMDIPDTELPAEHLVVGAVAVVKLIDEDGDVYLRMLSSTSLAIFERIGMLRTAEAIELADCTSAGPDRDP